jgi:oligosaccharyltransferase complex subunit epsilon
MAPKKNAAASSTTPTSTPSKVSQSANSAAQSIKASANSAAQTIKSSTTPSRSGKSSNSFPDIVAGIWNNYTSKTPQRVKLLDTFMVFLLVVGALQFVYCVIAGNYVS